MEKCIAVSQISQPLNVLGETLGEKWGEIWVAAPAWVFFFLTWWLPQSLDSGSLD